MKELILDSVYTIEPSCAGAWNDGHWNYQWDGRSSDYTTSNPQARYEGNGIYTLKDAFGNIWQTDEEGLKAQQGQ